MLRKLILSGRYILVITLILFAILISVVRGYPSIYQNYLPAIQENISSILGKPVQVDSMRIDWHGFTPKITAKNLTIYEDKDGYDQLLNVDQAEIFVDTYKSIITKNFVFKELTFDGGNLEVVRTVDEKILLNSIDISERLAERKNSNQSNQLKINLLNSSISIIDEIKKLDYFFDRVDIVLGFTGDRFKVSSKFKLPSTLGNSLVVTADIQDFHKGFKTIKGKFYAKGENINLELLHDFLPALQIGIKQGASDFQIWGDLNSLNKRRIVGNLDLHDLVYQDVEIPISNIPKDQEITKLAAEFRLTGDIQDWHLALNQVEVHCADVSWPGKQYEVSCINCGEDDFILAAAMDYINSDQLLSTMQRFPYMAEKLNEVLKEIEIHGVLHKSQLLAQLKNNQLTKYAYKSSVQQANISIPDHEISVNPIAGDVVGNHRDGSIDLSSNNTNVTIGKVLKTTLENQNIKGIFSWQFENGKLLAAMENVTVEANEMTASLQGVLQLADKQPYVDIQIDIPYVHADTIKQYVPLKKMRPRLAKWLEEGIVSGTFKDGKILFHGNMSNFKFIDKPSSCEISAKIENGVIDYRRDWPKLSGVSAELKIKNDYLEVVADKGTILDSSIKHVHAQINNLKLPRLVIDGIASGPASNILTYLQQSSILPENSNVVRSIDLSGNTNLDLDLSLTLTKKLQRQVLVSGEIELDNTGLKVNALSLPFKNLNGKLKFDKNGAEGNGLRGELYGQTIKIDAAKTNSGRTLLSVSGDVDLDTYFSSNYPKLGKYIKGKTLVSSTVDLPSFEKNSKDKSVVVNADSDLYGVSTELPEPFQKAFDETRNLAIQSINTPGSDSSVFANLQDKMFMQAFITQGTSKLSNMELRAGNDQFNLPSDGLKISGKLSDINITDWKEVIQSEGNKAFELKEIDVFVNKVTLGNLDLEKVEFRTTKNANFWAGNINSPLVKGSFDYPIDSGSGSVATANFDYFLLEPKQNSASSNKTDIDPRNLPALVINAKRFEYSDAKLSDVAIKTKPSASGLTIDSLQANSNDLQIAANGIWDVDAQNLQRTNLAINLQSQNLENSLQGLGFDSAIAEGEGSIAADFTWPKAPYQFSLATVAGSAKLRFNDGTITSVDPGNAGRLIGLVNLSEISRRLSLDFTDFFTKGYSFEKIRGNLVFKDANLTTDNLKIKGPSADLLIQGRTGIDAKDYDQIITVTPSVSGGLPWIGLAVGGPLGAVGVIVGEKIAKSIGVDVNKVTEIKYSLKGSWDDPQIESLSQKVAGKNTSPSAQGQPSPDTYHNPEPEPPASTP